MSAALTILAVAVAAAVLVGLGLLADILTKHILEEIDKDNEQHTNQ